jgi:hypothetical protein
MAEMETSDHCIYCGRAADDSDHVPPQKLFPRPRSADLITVPSCRSCNGGAKKDDEYFIWAITCSANAVGREADAAREQRFQQPVPRHRRTMVDRLRARTALVDVVTPAGLELGGAPGYRLEVERVHRVLARIVRGLYFHETGTPVSSEMVVSTSFEPPSAAERETVRSLLLGHERSVARGAFRYWLGRHPEVREIVVCPMVFFRRVLAIGKMSLG